jgi:GLPGLI family protein
MKIKIILTILYFSLNYSLIAQDYSGQINYSKSLVASSDNSNNYERYKDYELDFKELNYILKFNNIESLFQCEERINMNDDARTRFVVGAGNGKGTTYVNIQTNMKIHEKEAFGGQFLVTSNISDVKWKLYNETEKIGSYVCYKATTIYVVINSKGTFNHPVTAWYTSEIPVGFGPIGYGGLPGLIVELSIQNFKYQMEQITFNPKKKFKIKKPTKGKLVTEEEFNAIGKEAMGNFKSRISN